MRILNFFRLALLAGLCLWQGVSQAAPLAVHVLDNLEPLEQRLAYRELRRLGYRPAPGPLFSASTHAVLITKVLNEARETESYSFEVVRMHRKDTLPESVFEMKTKAPSLQEFFKNAPASEQVRNASETLTPVAALR